MAILERQQPSGSSNSVEQMLTDLLQLVGEILLIRRPRVHTAAAPDPLPPRQTANLFNDVTSDRCPFCPGGQRVPKELRLMY